MELGARIGRWRRFRGLTLKAVASAIGVTAAAVCQWEKGLVSPTQENLTLLVAALGLTMESFYGRVPRARQLPKRAA
jgi:transcriptional regulator with XRE-family HTH domain